MSERKATKTTMALMDATDRDELSQLAMSLRTMTELPFSQLIEAAGLSPGRDLRHCDWSGMSFDDEDLSGYDFTGADLTGCTFRGALVAKALFDEADVDERQLRQAADFAGYSASARVARVLGDVGIGVRSVFPRFTADLSEERLEFIPSAFRSASFQSGTQMCAFLPRDPGSSLLGASNLDGALEALVRTRAVERYCLLQSHVHSGGVIVAASDFSRQFNHYYRVRRDPEWQEHFFSLLRELRDQGSHADIQFRDVLQLLWRRCGRLEASFASKLVATLDPNRAVLDSVVLTRLGLRLPYHNQPDRLERTVQVYDDLGKSMRETLASSLWARQSEAFDAAFLAGSLAVELTEMKKLDFLLWAAPTSRAE